MQQMSAKDAHEFLKKTPDAVLIDVRSEMEFLFVGHPVGAIHIPWNELPDWEVDPEHFLAQTRKAASMNRPVVLICRSGKRSAEAGAFLEAHGFPEVYNVKDGFEGSLDAHRHRSSVNGWRNGGLPWEQT
jgi:rhodanese-related sulfurtransferase